MPFYSVPKLDVGIRTHNKQSVFEVCETSVFSYKPDRPLAPAERDRLRKLMDPPKSPEAKAREVLPEPIALQRLGTGEALDFKVWQFKEEKRVKCEGLEDVRFFRLTFKGQKFNERLKEGGANSASVNLYRSIISRNRVVFTIRVGELDVTTLEVDLAYHLEKLDEASGPASC